MAHWYGCLLYELGSMKYMNYCLGMLLVLWGFSDWLVKHELSVAGRNSITLVVRALGSASSVGRNSLDPPKGSPWWCLIYWT